MGASTFFHAVPQTDLKETAFLNLVEKAQYDYGHSGYTGTVAEKSEFIVFELEPVAKALNIRAIETLIYQDFKSLFGENAKTVEEVYGDKWGPALCFDTNEYTVFCGYASA